MIIGPDNTPYEGGFYMFSFEMPNDYPRNPPKVKFLTTNGSIRFHPNLYSNGKVCLSILGTWSGPKWSPVMTIKSVLLSLESILIKHPLRNEPCYENIDIDSTKNIDYNIFVSYFNYDFAINKMLEGSTEPRFQKYIRERYITFYPKYEAKLENLKNTHPTEIEIFTIYSVKLKLNFNHLQLLPITAFDENL